MKKFKLEDCDVKALEDAFKSKFVTIYEFTPNKQDLDDFLTTLKISGLFEFPSEKRVLKLGDKYHNAFHGFRYVVMYNRNGKLALWNADCERWSNSNINNFAMIHEGWPT